MVNNEDKYKAYTLREQGYSWTDIGNKLEVNRKTAKRYCEQYLVCDLVPLREVQEPNIDVSRFKPLEVYGNAAVTCDWHIPLHSARMVNSLFEKSYELGIKQLIIAGDFFNMDTFSHYKPHQADAAFELEKEEACKIIDVALDIYDDIYISWGNHDFRMTKFLDFKLSYEYCIRWVLESLGEEKLSRVHVSNVDYVLYYPGGNDGVRLCHQTNFSTVPLSVARDFAGKYQMDILTAHSHQFAQGVAKDGETRIYEGGGLFDPAKTEYIQKTSKHHFWVQGYYIWNNGLNYPFSPVYKNI